MKLIIKVILMCFIFQSCQSEPKFDLAELTLKGEKISDLITKDMVTNVFPEPNGGPNGEYVIVKSDKFLNFNGTSLIGKQRSDSNRGVNGLSFSYNKKDSIIYRYVVHIFSENEANDLVKALKEKLGKPAFSKYDSPEDKKKDNFHYLLWEDTQNNLLYLLNYSLKDTQKANLEVIINSSDPNELNLIAPFQIWGEYISYRNKKENKNKSYQDFIKEITERTYDDYYESITK